MQIAAAHQCGMSLSERLVEARRRRFAEQKEAAEFLSVPIGTYGNHEAGSRGVKRADVERYAKAFGVRASWLSHGDGPMTDNTVVPLVGRISAGGAIDTSTEQAEPGVEYEAELLVNVPDAVQAYEVVGESMLPVFEPGMVIVCRGYSDEPDRHLGLRLAVGLRAGDRYIKRLVEGTEPGRYNLESLNAGHAVMRNVEIEWVARIAAYIPAEEWKRLRKVSRAT